MRLAFRDPALAAEGIVLRRPVPGDIPWIAAACSGQLTATVKAGRALPHISWAQRLVRRIVCTYHPQNGGQVHTMTRAAPSGTRKCAVCPVCQAGRREAADSPQRCPHEIQARAQDSSAADRAQARVSATWSVKKLRAT
jgi:hypothetical protein